MDLIIDQPKEANRCDRAINLREIAGQVNSRLAEGGVCREKGVKGQAEEAGGNWIWALRRPVRVVRGRSGWSDSIGGPQPVSRPLLGRCSPDRYWMVIYRAT